MIIELFLPQQFADLVI